MNRKIRQLAAGLMVLYVVLFAAMNYWQVGRESELNAMSGNTRAIRREFSRPRGEIISADGVVAARSFPLPDDNEFPYQRQYPTEELFANVTGYYSLALGATQLERTQNAVLTGQTAEQRIGNLEDIVTGGDGTGDVHMTLRADLQETARQALDGRRGSVVMLDTQTGAVLAMYSNPTYDPNRIVDTDFDAARVALEELLESPGNPLLANAYQERYMPGSTFKVLTTGIALDAGVIGLDTQFERLTEWTPPQTSNPIQNYDGSNCGGDLREAFRRSCNIPFAQTALNVGIPGMIDGVQRWGVGERIPFVDNQLTRAAASTFGNTDNLDQQLPLLAMRGFGQQEDPDGAAAHGDGGGGRRQRRRDDEAVRRRLDVRQSGPHADAHTSGGVAATDQPGDCGDAQLADAERRHRRHGELLPAASTVAFRSPPRPARRSSTSLASPSDRTPGSSPSPRPMHRAMPCPSCSSTARKCRLAPAAGWPARSLSRCSTRPSPMVDSVNSRPAVVNDRYEVQKRIGRGGMADVFLGHDRLLDRQVAIKMLFPEFAVDPNFVERFRREAQAAANLNHPNIVNVFDWGKHASTYFIAMEYVEGRTLADILRSNGHLTSKQAAEIASEVAAALGFAHSAGLVHRDIKPANILIGTNGSVKVADFGIARALNAPTESNLTQAGAVMGTATYFSPEQAQGAQPDPRSDLYSLGVVMYEMIAGRPPFTGDNPVGIAYRQVHDYPTPLNQLVADVPRPFEAIVAKLLAKDPAVRYSTADALREDLRRFRMGERPVALAVGGRGAAGAGGGDRRDAWPRRRPPSPRPHWSPTTGAPRPARRAAAVTPASPFPPATASSRGPAGTPLPPSSPSSPWASAGSSCSTRWPAMTRHRTACPTIGAKPWPTSSRTSPHGTSPTW